MIICSLKHRDDERNDPGHIVAKFSGEEMIALNRIVYHATKELHGKSVDLELYKSICTTSGQEPGRSGTESFSGALADL